MIKLLVQWLNFRCFKSYESDFAKGNFKPKPALEERIIVVKDKKKLTHYE